MFNANLKRGSLELLILSVLDGRNHHGYQIGKLLEERSDGQLELQVSTLYSALYRMENRRWIEGRWVEKQGQRRRCYYSLTPKGREILSRRRQEWKAFTAMVEQVIGVDYA